MFYKSHLYPNKNDLRNINIMDSKHCYLISAIFLPLLSVNAQISNGYAIYPYDDSLTQCGYFLQQSDRFLYTASAGNQANTYKSDFSDLDLSGADFKVAAWVNEDPMSLREARFTDALINNVYFEGMINSTGGITFAMIQGTTSYKNNDLSNVRFGNDSTYQNDFQGWDLSGMNLSNAQFSGVRNFNSVSLNNAIIQNARFDSVYISDSQITASQLTSTQSYKDKNLSGVYVGSANFDNVDFSGQNLSGVTFSNVSAKDANFTDAVINGGYFSGTDSTIGVGFFTDEQFISTASYKNKDLQNVSLFNFTVSYVSLADMRLNGADMKGVYDGTTLASSDLRGGSFLSYDSSPSGITVDANNTLVQSGNIHTDNTIFSDGTVLSYKWADTNKSSVALKKGIYLNAYIGLEMKDLGDNFIVLDPVSFSSGHLTIYDHAISVKVEDNFVIASGSDLTFHLESGSWQSAMTFLTLSENMQVSLGGKIIITLDSSLLKSDFEGKTLQLIDWSGLFGGGTFSELDILNLFGFADEDTFFSHIDFSSLDALGLDFNRSSFLTDGSLSFIPEVSSYALFFGFVTMAVAVCRRRRR